MGCGGADARWWYLAIIHYEPVRGSDDIVKKEQVIFPRPFWSSLGLISAILQIYLCDSGGER